MFIDNLNTRLQTAFEYMKENDYYQFEVTQLPTGGIRIYIGNSVAVGGSAMIDIDHQIDGVDVNLILPQGKDHVGWMDMTQFEAYDRYISDLTYLMRQVTNIVRSK
jgi:hypothetical protein